MNTRWFALDDIASTIYGIAMSGHPSFTAPTAKTTKVSVPGRNGDLLFVDESFENISCTIPCFILHGQYASAISEANKWICKSGYRKLTFDGDPEAYRMAYVKNGVECNARMKLLAPFELQLDCKPQRFMNSGSIILNYTSSGSLTNPFYGGLPLIRVYGTGSFSINGHSVTVLSSDEYVDIDCELQDAFKGSANKNSTITCEDFPTLSYGENLVILGEGITKLEITPRWYDV